MSDLCAPIYVVMGSAEELTFWCFTEVMNRMVSPIFTFESGHNRGYQIVETELPA